jgi:hypothetical protein
MFSKTLFPRMTRVLSVLLFLSLIASALGLGVVLAQEAGTETPVLKNVSPVEGTPTPTLPSAESTPTPEPPPAPLPTLTPKQETLSALNLSIAGTGTWFRARISLKQPRDLARLNEWNITVLDQGDGAAYRPQLIIEYYVP